MDDVMELSCHNLDHYYVWCYLMYQFDLYDIKIAAAKVQLMSEEVQFLGYNINVKKNQYGLTAERRTDFANWKFPTTRNILLSRLCIINYFSCLIPSFKVICQSLFCLVNNKTNTYHVRLLHVREFEMMKFAIELNSSYYIPDLSYPTCYSCDASFSSIAGNMLQWIPDPEAEGGFTLHMVAQFSKKFSATENAKSPLYKEVLSCLATLKEYETFIRNSSSFSLLFSDASSLSMVSKLQHCNSRLHSFSVYLQSFPSIFIYFSPSSRLNFMSDYVSKIYCGKELRMDQAIPQKYLENVDNIRIKKGMLVSPQALHAVLQAPIPDFFSNIPERRKQAFDPIFSASDFKKMLEGPCVEEAFLKGLLFGFESIPQNSVAYQKKDRSGIVSKSEFNKMYTKSSGDKLREHFRGLIEHSVCYSEFEDLIPDCRHWVSLLNKHLSEHPRLKEPSLRKSCRHYLQVTSPDLNLFRNVVNQYQESSLYNTLSPVDEIFPTLFVTIYSHKTSNCTFRNNGNNLVISSNDHISIEPWKVFILKVGLTIINRYNITVSSQFSDRIIYHAEMHTFHAETYLEEIIIYNNSSSSLSIPKLREIFLLKIHRQVGDVCRCEENMQIKFILEKETEKNQASVCELLFSSVRPSSSTRIHPQSWSLSAQSRAREFLAQSILKTEGNNEIDSSSVSQEINECIKEEKIYSVIGEYKDDLMSSLPCDSPCQVYLSEVRSDGELPGVNVTAEQHNSIILCGLLLNRKDCFTPALVKQLQDTCPYLVKIKEQVKNSEVQDFRLTKGILYKRNKWDLYVLCLDRVTMAHIVSSIHASARHYSNQMMQVYISSYFFCKDIKKVIEEERARCSICFFNVRCRKIKYVNNRSETEPQQVFSRIYTDADEFLSRAPKSRFAFLIIFVCAVSGYLVPYPLKALNSDELCSAFETYLKHFGIMHTLTSDFASMYRSKQFRELLLYYNVSHKKRCPKRSPEAGTSEVNIKEYRRTYMNVLLSLCGSETENWDEFIPLSTLIFNSQSIHSSDNTISRFNLFFNASRYSAPWLYTKVGDSPIDITVRQQLAFKSLFDKRLKFRQSYKTKENPFSVGQFCIRPLSKDEFQSRDGSKSLQNTVQQLFVVKDTYDNSCLVSSLLDSSESVQDISALRPMEPCELKHVFGKALDSPGSFSQSIYKRGGKDAQQFRRLEILPSFLPRCSGMTDSGQPHVCPDSGVFDRNPEDDEMIDIGSLEPQVGSESQEIDEVSEKNEDEIEGVSDEDVDQGATSIISPHHPYHLRPRLPRSRPGQHHDPGASVDDQHPGHSQSGQQSDTSAGGGHQGDDRVLQGEELVQSVNQARSLRPRRQVKYTYLMENRNISFKGEVEVCEYKKNSPPLSKLSAPCYYPCSDDGFHVDLRRYIPEKTRFDPTLSKREVMILLAKYNREPKER